MSLVTLKKKTSAKYNNVSVNTGVFSLNGTRRIQGYVGQSLFGRHMDPCACTNDSTVVKKSSINTRGQIRTKHKQTKIIIYFQNFRLHSLYLTFK